MASIQSYVVRAAMWANSLYNPSKSRPIDIKTARINFDKIGLRLAPLPHTRIIRANANGVLCEWTIPNNHNDAHSNTQTENIKEIIFFVHGGGYVMGSFDTYRGLVSRIAHQTRMHVVSFEYGLAPERPFPHGLNDTLNVYEWLLTTYKNAKIHIVGDSAGGGLGLALLQYLKEEKIKMPEKCVWIAPWADLELKNPSIEDNKHVDYVLAKTRMQLAAKGYANGLPLNHLFISPINADFGQFPPTLIQVGTNDILLDDSKILAEKMKKANVEVTLKIWENVPHLWHMVGDFLPESTKAIRQMANFLRK